MADAKSNFLQTAIIVAFIIFVFWFTAIHKGEFGTPSVCSGSSKTWYGYESTHNSSVVPNCWCINQTKTEFMENNQKHYKCNGG